MYQTEANVTILVLCGRRQKRKHIYLLAATAHTAACIQHLDSLPPNPPPSRFTLDTTLLLGTPNALATNVCA